MDFVLQTRTELSADNHGPYIVITSYILMSVMILSTIARLRPTRHTFSEVPQLKECLILLAMVGNIQATMVALITLIELRYC